MKNELSAAIRGDGGLLQVRKRLKFTEPGIDLEDLAAALGVSQDEIRQACEKRGIHVRWTWRPISEEDAEEVIGAVYRRLDVKVSRAAKRRA